MYINEARFARSNISKPYFDSDFRFVSIVVVKIPLGPVPLMECTFASTVQASTGVSAST